MGVDALPERLDYLRGFLPDLRKPSSKLLVARYERMPAAERVRVAAVGAEVLRRDDLDDIVRWLRRCSHESWRSGDAGRVAALLELFCVFGFRGEQGVEGFRTRLDAAATPDFDAIPEAFGYLREIVRKYEKVDAEDETQKYLEEMTEDDIEELAAVAERVRLNGDYQGAIGEWLDAVDWNIIGEAARVYFFFGLLDELGLEFE